MALLNLTPEESLRSGKHGGQCFQNSPQGPTLKNNNHPRRWRSPNQLNRQSFMMRCVQEWRSLSGAEQTLWSNWASTYPQPTLHDPFIFLTGYELFIKRNFYLYMSYPDGFVFMTSPVFTEYDIDSLTAIVSVSDVALFLDLTFSNADSNLDCILFLSQEQSSGLEFGNTRWRYVATVRNENQSIDITTAYLHYFGVLPAEGQKLFLSVLFCGKDNGQFTFHQLAALEVQPPAPPIWPVKFGALYNIFALIDARNFAPAGWSVPTSTIFTNMISSLGGGTITGGKLKETGFEFWNSPNSGATNETFFNLRGAGYRHYISDFQSILISNYLWSKTLQSGSLYWSFQSNYNNAYLSQVRLDRRYGNSVRLVADSNADPNGSVGEMEGNDGKKYRTIVVAGYKFMADNSAETKFRNGDAIPVVTSFTSWSALTSAGMCAYANIDSNVPF